MSLPICPRCGVQAHREDARFCRRCGAPLSSQRSVNIAPRQPTLIVVQQSKSPGVAAVLSFFWCGLGHIYDGQIVLGVLLMIVYPLSVWVSFLACLWVLAGFLRVFPLVFAAPAVWLFGMIDAYRTAERINRDAVREVM